MPPENYIITTFSISEDEFYQIFPWFENLSIEKPKSKRGRKPITTITTIAKMK